jgi:hypothetical protein
MLLARKGDEHFLMAVGATYASAAKMQIATAEKPAGHVADDRSPRAVTPCEAPYVLVGLGRPTANCSLFFSLENRATQLPGVCPIRKVFDTAGSWRIVFHESRQQ